MNTATKIDKYTDGNYQRAVDEFVGREVIANASTLVYELTQKFEHFPDYEDELLNAFHGLPDYEETALQEGWKPFTDEYGANCWRGPEGSMTWCGTAQNLCEEFDLETDDENRSEIFEHWIVSSFLADELEERGELILRDFFGFTIWGRSTTGQAISMDRVICDIYDALQERVKSY